MIKEVLQQLEPLDAQIDALCSRADDAEMASTTTHAAELAELSAEENTLLQRCTSLTPEDRAAVSPELAIVTCNQRETEGKKYIRRTALDTVWTVPGFVHLMTDGEMWVCDRIVSDVKY